MSSEFLEELSQEILHQVEAKLIVGAELLVVKNRHTVYHSAYGWLDRERQIRMVPNTIFNIRSMTKPLTGAAAQCLIDDGELSLDDRVMDLIPGFDNESCESITVEHLLTHRSGLPLSILTRVDEYETLFDQANTTGERGTQFEVGAQFWYSDAGSDVLGAVVEEVSGMNLDEFVQERLLDPLQMQDSFYAKDREDPRFQRIASLYGGGARSWQRFWSNEQDPFYPFAWGSQTLYSTPADYARFLAMWMDRSQSGEQQVLSTEAVDRTLTPVSEMLSLGQAVRMPTFFRDLETWYGQMSVLYLPQGQGPDARPVCIGHSGSDGTIAWAFPDHDLMVLIFTQSRGSAAVLRWERWVDRLLLHPERTRNAPPLPAELAPLTGSYRANFDRFKDEEFIIRGEDGYLVLDVPIEFVRKLVGPAEDGSFEITGSQGGRLSFKKDADGSVEALMMGPYECPRIVNAAQDPSVSSRDG